MSNPKSIATLSRRVTRGFLSLVLVAIAAPGVAGMSNEARLETARRHFRTAELAASGSPVREAHYAKAESLAELVIAADPRSAEAHFMLFAARGRRMQTDHGRPSVANFWKFSGLNKHLTRTLELDPSHANALAAKGGLLLDLPGYLGGDVVAARRHLERAVELNPTGPGTRLTLARALMRQGDEATAREQVLIAAHYACVKRARSALVEAEALLAELDSDAL